MPTELREHQWELLDFNDETRSLVFGTEDTGYQTLSPPAWSAGDATDRDVPRGSEDGRYFGRDLRGGATIGFEIGVFTDRANDLVEVGSTPYETNVDYVEALQSWWDDEDLRRNPWDLAILRMCVAGRTWRAYGRPRRYDAVPTALTQEGYTAVVCDFGVMDNRVYSDEVETVSLSLVTPPSGGLRSPLVAPLTTTLSSVSDITVDVAGKKQTWPWVTFKGPVSRPRVEIAPAEGAPPGEKSVVIGLSTAIPEGTSVTVDPRPWSRGVTRDDGANYAGLISAETPILRELRLRPGNHPVTYSGIDATGTSQCFISWRTARSRP